MQADDSLYPQTIEEIARVSSPFQLLIRYPVEDVELGGKIIRAGETLGLILPSANRDPSVFTEPNRFDIARKPAPNFSFGSGLHYCFGAPLAKTEARLALKVMLERYPRIRLLDQPAQYHDFTTFKVLKTLMVEI